MWKVNFGSFDSLVVVGRNSFRNHHRSSSSAGTIYILQDIHNSHHLRKPLWDHIPSYYAHLLDAHIHQQLSCLAAHDRVLSACSTLLSKNRHLHKAKVEVAGLPAHHAFSRRSLGHSVSTRRSRSVASSRSAATLGLYFDCNWLLCLLRWFGQSYWQIKQVTIITRAHTLQSSFCCLTDHREERSQPISHYTHTLGKHQSKHIPALRRSISSTLDGFSHIPAIRPAFSSCLPPVPGRSNMPTASGLT